MSRIDLYAWLQARADRLKRRLEGLDTLEIDLWEGGVVVRLMSPSADVDVKIRQRVAGGQAYAVTPSTTIALAGVEHGLHPSLEAAVRVLIALIERVDEGQLDVPKDEVPEDDPEGLPRVFADHSTWGEPRPGRRLQEQTARCVPDQHAMCERWDLDAMAVGEASAADGDHVAVWVSDAQQHVAGSRTVLGEAVHLADADLGEGREVYLRRCASWSEADTTVVRRLAHDGHHVTQVVPVTLDPSDKQDDVAKLVWLPPEDPTLDWQAIGQWADRVVGQEVVGWPACVAPHLPRTRHAGAGLWALAEGGWFTPVCQFCERQSTCPGVDPRWVAAFGMRGLTPQFEHP